MLLPLLGCHGHLQMDLPEPIETKIKIAKRDGTSSLFDIKSNDSQSHFSL
jgi:hypothetical protein